uniref:Uncharacterized protein n=1 Tax=Xiphophorus maculatus TaxID=8083 RepID=A0A3B5Q7G2_XIPMA
MMQISNDPASNKHSLLNVMHRFMAAANNMDETIMVPSLLRDVPLEEQANNNNNNDDDVAESQVASNKQRDISPPLSNSSTNPVLGSSPPSISQQ